MLAQIDMDAFYCHVEAQRDPTLAGAPFVVGGQPDTRGVVASASYQARRYHIHAAMPTAQALRLCPQLRIVATHFVVYRATSQRLMRLLADFSPHVMQLSIVMGSSKIGRAQRSSRHSRVKKLTLRTM